MKLKFFVLGVIFTLIVIAISYSSFNLGKVSKNKNIIPTPSAYMLPPSSSPTQIPDRTDEVKVKITSSVKTGEFEGIEEYINNPVIFRIENSGCCSPQTPPGAVTQLEYLNTSKGTWDFDQDNDVAKSLAASYPEHYSNSFIGIASDGYSVAFQLSENGIITKVSISASYKLLLE